MSYGTQEGRNKTRRQLGEKDYTMGRDDDYTRGRRRGIVDEVKRKEKLKEDMGGTGEEKTTGFCYRKVF